LKSYYGVVEILDIMILVDDGVENVRELAESLHLKINEVSPLKKGHPRIPDFLRT
jgi:hypothetical protein